MTGRTPAAHDQIFRVVVEHPGRATRLAHGCLPDEVAAMIADKPLVRVPETFVDEDLRLHHVDALFKGELRDGRPAWVYILFEHKSWQNPWAPLQMLRYITRIWTWHTRQSEARPGVLPPVIPILVHQGRQPWSGPLSVLDMVEADGALENLSRSLSCVLCDLGPTEDAKLPGDRDVQPVLSALKHVWDREVLDEVLDMILRGLTEGGDLELLVVSYISDAYSNLAPGQLEAALRRARPERWEELLGPAAEELIRKYTPVVLARERAEGEAIGEARGEVRGEARGEARGKAKTLLRQARIRFGNVPEERYGQIMAADTATLDRWLDALLTAENLEAVFRSPH